MSESPKPDDASANADSAKPDNTKINSARTWTVTLAVSSALLFAMYGLAYVNDAHVRVAAPSLIGTASGAPSR